MKKQPTKSTPGAGKEEPKIPKAAIKEADNPWKTGFKPNGKRSNKTRAFFTKKTLMQTMLSLEITVADLPTHFADKLRAKYPGFLERVDKKFTMAQILELAQFQLLFSKSDYVVQDAIIAIKDRNEGKPMQMLKVQQLEVEPTKFILPDGQEVFI